MLGYVCLCKEAVNIINLQSTLETLLASLEHGLICSDYHSIKYEIQKSLLVCYTSVLPYLAVPLRLVFCSR